MSTIVDYNSLTQAITDFTHRSDLAAGVYTDYFIQGAIEKIQNDIFAENFGNGIQFQENSYPPTVITNGVAPVPNDWLAPKLMTVSDGSGDVFTLIWKAAAWIYDQYPVRQAEGLPAYIARDVSAGSVFPTYSNYLSFTCTAGQTAFTLTGGPSTPVLFVSLAGQVMVPGTDYTIAAGVLTLGSGAVAGQTLLIQYAPFENLTASNASSFIFAPYPDSAYTIQGTYYQNCPMLSSTQATNWMVLNCPTLLHAACMIKAGEFLLNDQMVARWDTLYQPRLIALVNRDKAERWGASTMQIELG